MIPDRMDTVVRNSSILDFFMIKLCIDLHYTCEIRVIENYHLSFSRI